MIDAIWEGLRFGAFLLTPVWIAVIWCAIRGMRAERRERRAMRRLRRAFPSSALRAPSPQGEGNGEVRSCG